MRKTICFVCVSLIVISGLSADVTGFYSGTDVNGSASTNVALNIDGGENSTSKIELYFIGSEDQNQSATSTAPASAKPAVSLKFNSTPNVADNNEDSVYAWWRVLYGGDLDIQLEIEKPLTKGVDSTIDWNAKWTIVSDEETALQQEEVEPPATADDTTTVYSNAGKTGAKTIVEHVGSKSVQTIGQAKIDIQTDPNTAYSLIGTGTYSANLVLKCSTT